MPFLYVEVTAALHIMQTRASFEFLTEELRRNRAFWDATEELRRNGAFWDTTLHHWFPTFRKVIVPKLSPSEYMDLLNLTLNIKFEVIFRNAENQRGNVVLSVQFVGWNYAFIPFQFHGLVPFFSKNFLALGLEMVYGTKWFLNYSLAVLFF